MPQHPVIVPRQKVPDLEFQLVGGRSWSVAEQTPEHFTLVLFYRGYHCPICKKQLQEMLAMKGEFAAAGVNLVALSSNDKELAEKTNSEWELDGLDLGYGLSLEKAAEWGLHISAKREGTAEPDRFSEPGLFLIRPDRTLYFSSIQTMPFARPQLADILSAAKFVIEKNYPARGEMIAA